MKKKKHKRKKKKTNKIKNIFIMLLIFLLFMGIILIVAFSHEDSNNDGALIDEIIQGEVKKLDLTNKDVNRLYNLFLENSSFKIDYAEGLNNSIESRLYYTFLSFNKDDFEEVRCSDVGLVILYDEHNFFKALCSTNTTYPEDLYAMETEIRSNNTYGIKVDKFKNKYVELFGNVEFDKLDFYYSSGQVMHYDSRTDMYLKYYTESGGVGSDIEGTFKSASLRGRKLEIIITYQITDFDDEVQVYDVVYKFEKNKKTNNFIFMSREEK